MKLGDSILRSALGAEQREGVDVSWQDGDDLEEAARYMDPWCQKMMRGKLTEGTAAVLGLTILGTRAWMDVPEERRESITQATLGMFGLGGDPTDTPSQPTGQGGRAEL